MKKKAIWIIALLLIVSGFIGGFFVVRAPTIQVDAYLFDYCGGCGSGGVSGSGCATCYIELVFRTKYTNLIKEAGLADFVKLIIKNTAYRSSEPLNALLEGHNLSEDTELPIVFVGNTILYSEAMVEEKLIATINENLTFALKLRKWLTIDLPNKEIYDTTNKILYFSMEGCPDCAESDAYLNSLSEKLNLYIYDDIEIIYIGNDAPPENRVLLEDMYALYGREDESIWVPTMFINNECLIAIDEIETFFDDYTFGSGIETKVTVGYE